MKEQEEKIIFVIGEKVEAINNTPLQGNEVTPPLIKGDEYYINDIVEDREGNQHLDVGIKSDYNYIRSWETKEELPNGNKIHWCHPSRFVKV